MVSLVIVRVGCDSKRTWSWRVDGRPWVSIL